MANTKWSILNRMQLGEYAEYYAKMEFASYDLDVYTSEVDDHDRFKARVTQDWGKPKVIGEIEMAEEEKELNRIKMEEIKEKIKKNKEISRKSND